MDPLSLTASIIAICQVSATVGKGLNKIISLRNAPDIFQALNNEVADLQCIVQDTDDLLRQHFDSDPIASIGRALDKAKGTLNSLQSLLSYELTTVSRKDNEVRLDKSAWLRRESKLQRLKDEIRECKLSLSSALSILTSSTSLRISAQMTSVYGLLQAPRLEARYGQQAVYEVIRGASIPHSNTQMSNIPIAPLEPQRSVHATTIELVRNTCGIDCNCKCHESFRFRSPGFLDSIFGSLFLGYEASPWSSQSCQNARCRSSSTTVQYTFPKWFVTRTVAITMSCNQPGSGPELLLRVLRFRPNNTLIFRCAQFGHLEEAKRLLDIGEASIVDVNSYNCTALQIALDHNQIEVAELLVRMGADKLHRDEVGMQPYTMAWELLLSKGRNMWTKEDDRLCSLFGDQSQLELFHFPELHRAYLGTSGKTFANVLSSSPRSSIDEKDALGRTVLSWASQRGDEESMCQLLCCGADPNATDTCQQSPLHWSVWTGNEKALELLLRAKADVDLKDICGRTTLSTIASDGLEPGMIVGFMNLLLSYGADIKNQDQDGLMPLHRACAKNHHLVVAELLKRGADINAMTIFGFTSLQFSLLNRSHDAMIILLDHADLNHNIRDEHGSTLLHYAAYYADIESLRILSSKGRDKIDCLGSDESYDGQTPIGCAQWRREFNDEWSNTFAQPRDPDPAEWYSAFEELIDSLTSSQQPTRKVHCPVGQIP